MNRRSLFNIALTLALGLMLGALSPDPIKLAAVGSFMFFAAMGVALMALLRKEKMFQPRITRWDVAAGFYLFSMLTNLFVDHEAVIEFLERVQRDGMPG